MRAKITLKEFITKSNEIHNNKYTYSSSVYTDAKASIIITCSIHRRL